MFVVTWAGIASAVNLASLLRGVVQQDRLGTPQSTLSPELSTGHLTLRSVNCTSTTQVENLGEWVNYISGNQFPRPNEVRFEVKTETPLGSASPKHPVGSLGDTEFIVKNSTCQAIGMAFERNRGRIEALWGKEFRVWPPEIQFFRHCRNACFHGNSFDIRDGKNTPAINPNAPPKWRHLTIPGKSLNGSRFAGSFFDYQFVIPFLYDVGLQLK